VNLEERGTMGVDWIHLAQKDFCGGLLWTQLWNFGFCKRWRISQL